MYVMNTATLWRPAPGVLWASQILLLHQTTGKWCAPCKCRNDRHTHPLFSTCTKFLSAERCTRHEYKRMMQQGQAPCCGHSAECDVFVLSVTILHASRHVCVPDVPTVQPQHLCQIPSNETCIHVHEAYLWTILQTTFCFPCFLFFKRIHFIGVLSRENPAGNVGNFSHWKPVQRGLLSVPGSTNGIAMEKTG